MKKVAAMMSLILFSALTPVTALAGEWRNEAGHRPGEERWRYENDDGAWTDSGIVMTRNAQTPLAEEGAEHMKSLTIETGGRQFEAVLADNRCAEAFAERLPAAFNMSELNGNEKYCYLPSGLPADAQNVGTVHAGDLMLFGSDCLVLFYEDFRTSYRYTRLGTVTNPEGLAGALGRGSAQVAFRFGGQP